MSQPIRAQVILHTNDNLSANYITNSWCIVTTDLPSDSEYAEYTTAFKDFYDDLSGFLSLPVAQNGHEIKYYDLTQLIPPNYPAQIDTFNLTSAPSVAQLPSEVAVCLSFQGTKVPGSPQNRRRGRVYIGPVSQSTNTLGRPSSTFQGVLAAAATTLCSNLAAASNIAHLGVWSHMDSAAVLVADGWVDDAYDTQRRRGVERTTRTTWVP